MRQRVKTLAGQSLFAVDLHTLLLRNVAIVAAFHRVQDGAPASDSLTIGVGMFERYCEFFRRHFRVVGLRELVRRLELGLPLSRELVITFDDGYRDNLDNAVPVLERLGLPATFFVVSRWLGTTTVPWWDRQCGVRHPWMTRDDVRRLHRRGFEIGAHTRHHVDLGRTSSSVAREEIAGSRRELESWLSAPVESFAYPYGRRENLTETNRDLVRAAGFHCCCSGFGGLNPAGADPFHLQRIPISPWFASPHQFGFDAMLRRSLLPASPPAAG